MADQALIDQIGGGIMRHLILGIAPILLGGLSLVGNPTCTAAQEAPGRYVLAPIEGGVVRLDTQTGELSECRRREDRLTCTPAVDAGRTPAVEADRLKRENEVGPSGQARPAPPAAAPAPGPSEREIDRALDVMERVLRRFQSIMRERPGEQPL
jgi:hypothetical protein